MTKYISQKAVAGLLGISPRQIANLIDAGIPTRLKAGRREYPWPAALHWYIKWKSESTAKKKEPVNFALARARKMEADASRAELDLRAAEGELIPFKTHEVRIGAICDRIRRVLMTVPSKYLSRIQVTRTELEAQAVGEKIRDETLLALQGTAGEIEEDPPEESEIEAADAG